MRNWILSAAILLSGAASAQPASIAFEVVSIKPAAPPEQMGQVRIGMSIDQGMMRFNNASVKDMIRSAYRVKDFQVEGPDSITSQRFDISAKLPAGSSQDQIPEMMQAMLAERFQLTLHRETKDHAVYALVVSKGGPKLKATETPVPADGAPAAAPGRGLARVAMEIQPDGVHMRASAATLGGLGEMMSRFTERPVVDMTQISGQYDFDLVFSPETLRKVQALVPGGPPASGGGPSPLDGASETGASVYESVQKYGLKLESRKAPIETLIVDRVEKMPTEN